MMMHVLWELKLIQVIANDNDPVCGKCRRLDNFTQLLMSAFGHSFDLSKQTFVHVIRKETSVDRTSEERKFPD